MSLMKAPRLERSHLIAIKSLLRFQFSEEVRVSLLKMRQNPDEEIAESILRVLESAEGLMGYVAPLEAAMTMMDLHDTDEAIMPLSDRMFGFYNFLLNKDIGPDTLKGIENTQDSGVSELMAELQKLQKETKQRFDEAMELDPDKVGKDGKVTLPLKSNKNEGLLN